MSRVLAMRLAAMAEVARGPQPVDVSDWASGLARASELLSQYAAVADHEHDWDVEENGDGVPVAIFCRCGERHPVRIP